MCQLEIKSPREFAKPQRVPGLHNSSTADREKAEAVKQVMRTRQQNMQDDMNRL
jgi:hypothetical protein